MTPDKTRETIKEEIEEEIFTDKDGKPRAFATEEEFMRDQHLVEERIKELDEKQPLAVLGEELQKHLKEMNERIGSFTNKLDQEIATQKEELEKLRAEEGKGITEFVSNSLDAIGKGLKIFGNKSGEKAKEIYHGISNNIGEFQKSMKESGVKPLEYLKKSGQLLSDMSKDFGEKLKTLGSKIATNVKDFFGKTKNLCESLSKEHIREIDSGYSKRLETIPEKEAVAVKTPHIPKSYTEHKKKYWANKNAHKLEYMRGDIKRKQREKSQSKNTYTEREHKKANPSTDRSR